MPKHKVRYAMSHTTQVAISASGLINVSFITGTRELAEHFRIAPNDILNSHGDAAFTLLNRLYHSGELCEMHRKLVDTVIFAESLNAFNCTQGYPNLTISIMHAT